MSCWDNTFSLNNEFLIEFFTRPETDIFNFDVLFGLKSGKTYQIPGHIINLDGYTHVK